MYKRLGFVASVVLALGAGVSIVLFGWLVTRHGLSMKYLLLPGFGAGMALGLFLSDSGRISAVLTLFSSLVAIYGTEVFLAYSAAAVGKNQATAWLHFPQDANARVAARRVSEEAQRNKGFDGRSRLEVVRSMRMQGVMAYPDVFPAVLFTADAGTRIRSILSSNGEEFLPLGGMARTTTVFCNESGEYMIYESDDHGFHNPSGLWERGSADIVALGDSYAHGVCVPSEKGFVAHIRSKYPQTINLGINGHGPLSSLAILKEYGPILEPKVVLWFYYEGNDLRDLDGVEKNSPLLMRYPYDELHSGARNPEIDRQLKQYLDRAMEEATGLAPFEAIVKVQHLRQALAGLYGRRPGQDGLPAELTEYLQHAGKRAAPQDMDLFERVLVEAKVTARAWGGQLVFVYLPTWERYRIPQLASQDRDRVLDIAKGLELPVVDIHDAFSRHPDPLSLFPSRRYAHYNEAGHELVGGEVLKAVDRLGTMSPRLQRSGARSQSIGRMLRGAEEMKPDVSVMQERMLLNVP